MQKRGLADVDWIIASGVFLVSLVTVLIFIKPGIIPLHSSDALLDIIEHNFRKDINLGMLLNANEAEVSGVYWNLYKTPLFIETVNLYSPPTTNCIELDFPYDWLENKITVFNDSFQSPVPFRLNGNKLIIMANLTTHSPDKEVYYIYYTNYEDILPKQTLDTSIGSQDCPSGVSQRIVTTPILTENFKQEYGVTESSKGISEKIIELGLTNINNIFGYNFLKERYGYPKLKEFSIELQSNNNYPKFEPIKPGDVNVYTRSWSDFVLYTNGTREPVIITIKVW